ncbi:MAG: DUF4199 domain-containing protein [Bacteroidia bacterium]|nr:DUF4199 domain-containing protein [Bacteroidia bacterium]
MSKKLLIYGLAFGSATAALAYIYLVSIVYSPDLWKHLVEFISELLIVPGIGIYLFLRDFKKTSPEEFMLGRVVFLGFILSIIIGASVSLLYSYVHSYNPGVIARMVDLKINSFKTSKYFTQFSAQEVEQKLQEIRDMYNVRTVFVDQLFRGGARGLFLSAVFGFFMKARMNRDY